jgi:hypothetical protein
MIPALTAAPTAASAGAESARTIPFDYSFQFKLEGERQRVHRSTVIVSVEASFTAVSIGYGVVPEVTPIIFGPELPPPPAPPPIGILAASTPTTTLVNIRLGDLFRGLETRLSETPDARKDISALEAGLLNGIRLNTTLAGLGLLNDGNAILDANTVQRLFQVVSAPSQDVQFLYALFDEGSGREFQSEPLLNIAGLGASDGKRPFRYFARPITFAPRATIRMDITELTDFRGDLHVSLHGYKLLGGAGTPTAARGRQLRRRGR